MFVHKKFTWPDFGCVYIYIHIHIHIHIHATLALVLPISTIMSAVVQLPDLRMLDCILCTGLQPRLA